MRSDDGLSVRCEIDDIQIVVTATAQTIDQRECAVAADVLQPLQSVVARNQLSLAARGIDEVRINRRRIGAVRSHRDAPALTRPAAEVVGFLSAVRQPTQSGAVGMHDIDLRVHSAARRERQGQPLAVGRPNHASDRVVAVRHLQRRATIDGSHPDLRHAGPVGHERESCAVRRKGRRRGAADSCHARHHLDELRVVRRLRER